MSSSAALAPVSARQDFRFVARQPVLDGDEQLYGYGLLFLDGIENFFHATDLEAAARSTLDSTLLMGFYVLCDGQRAFLNCARDLLLKDGIRVLPPSQTVVEVLETVAPDNLGIAACETPSGLGLHRRARRFRPEPPPRVSGSSRRHAESRFRTTTVAERAALVQRHRRSGCRMLAKKVETRQQFRKARDMGFVYFQGYFFAGPRCSGRAKFLPTV